LQWQTGFFKLFEVSGELLYESLFFLVFVYLNLLLLEALSQLLAFLLTGLQDLGEELVALGDLWP